MKPPVQYAMMPPRVDAPKVGKMKPVEQPKVAPMRGIDAALDYYLGPTGIPDRLAALNSMLNPVETLGGSMRASQRMLAPDTAPMGRVQAAGDMLSGVAGFAAPMVAASKVGVPAASAVADAFTGLSTGAQKAGATVVDRLNQPGPMPTLYSNPIPGLMGPKKGIKAYHGSPHSFDKFSMDKIGTGEGAQAYGHGLYFAENEAVAKGYRDTLAQGGDVVTYGGKDILRDGKDFTDFYGGGTAQSRAQAALARRRGAIPEALEDLKRRADDYGERNDTIRERAALDAYNELKRADAAGEIKAQINPGSMYEVNINADPADFLDWDAFPDTQTEAAKKYFSEVFGSVPDQSGGVALTFRDSALNRAKGTYGPTSGTSELVSKEMLQRGIPGIRYLDAGSRGAGDGSRNYVVFDDSLIDIIRKYGIAGLMMGGMMQPNQAQAGQ
jgi:hypothetical protein